MRALVAAALLASALPAPGPSWSVATSAHFEVYATGQPKRAADALAMFEDVRAFFASYLSLPDSPRPPMRVLVFSGETEFAPYRVNESASAYYQHAHNRDYIVLKDFDADAFHIVAHEYAHAALGLKGADFPPWLSEGLAEFFSSVALEGGKARLGGVPSGRLAALAPAMLMSVKDLVAVRRDSAAYNLRDHAGVFYAESWALTHMLLLEPRYRDGAQRVLALTQAGTESAAALSQVYGKTTAEIETDLRAYIARGHFGFASVDYRRAAAAAAAPPSPVPAFDAALVLADLLASENNRDLDARAALAALGTEQPDNLALMETRAFFELRTRGISAAEPFLARAVDGGSRDPAVLAEYALRIADANPDRASELLTRALALAPNDAEIRVHAAAVLIRLQKPRDAIAVLGPIGRVPSELAFEYYQIIANAEAADSNFDEAAAAAARVLAAANSPDQVAFARTLLKQVGGPPDVSKMAEGTLKNLNCDGAVPILEIATADGPLALALDDPSQIVIAGSGSMKMHLDCGEQSAPVRVGYSEDKPPSGSAGRVRFLDFRKKSGQAER